MIIFINANVSKKHYIVSARKAIESLQRIDDIECVLSPENSSLLFGNDSYCQKTICDCDLIVSIGGDGTVLKTALLALEYDLPLVGINAGRLGYLCSFTLDDIVNYTKNPFVNLKQTIRNVLTMNYHGQDYLAINDFIFASKNSGYTVEVNLQIGEKEIFYHASGVIVASATGSSAYNAAAGGSIISPNLNANVVTPICPCGEQRNSFVFNNNEIIKVKNKRIDDPIEICCDGITIGILDEEIDITKYKKDLILLHY